MGYGLTGIFFEPKEKKEILRVDLDFLKCLNDRSYSASFTDINDVYFEDSQDYNQQLLYRNRIEDGYFRDDILKQDFFKGERAYSLNIFPSYEVHMSQYDDHKEDYNKYRVEGVSINDMKNVIYITFYSYEVEKGHWFDYGCFEEARKIITKRYEDAREKLKKLTDQEYTKDWFEMSEDARNRWCEEVSWAQEGLEEEETEKEAIDKIVNLYDIVNNNLGIKVKEGAVDWNHFESRNCRLFIYVD